MTIRVIRRPRPHIIPITVQGERQWLCQSMEVQPRGRPTRIIGRWAGTPSAAYRRWRLGWAEALLKVAR